MNRQQGYAYLYVLFLIALLSISVTAVATVQFYETRRQEEQELLRIGREFRAALLSYRMAGPERAFPRSMQDLLLDQRGPSITRHLRRNYVDPITRQQEWGLVTQGDQIVGVYSLSSKAPLKQAGFEPEEAEFESASHYSDWKFLAVAVDQPSMQGR